MRLFRPLSSRALAASTLALGLAIAAVPACKSNNIDNRNVEATCAANFVDCNKDPADGCETNVAIDVANCGACGRTCGAANANGAGTCVDGQCQFACKTGFADCNRDGADGCETDLLNAADHCGTCDTACKANHAGAACGNGQCVVGTCESGYADCNKKAADGCETLLATSADHCGSCEKVCGDGNRVKSCAGGSCSTVCSPGYHACGSDCAADDSVAACGASCSVCPAGPNGSAAACIAGTCDFSPLVMAANADVALDARAIAVGDRDVFWLSADRKTIFQARKDGSTAPTVFVTLVGGAIPSIRAWKTELLWGTSGSSGKVFRASQDTPNPANPTVVYDAAAVSGRTAIGWDVAGELFAVADYVRTQTGNPNADNCSIRTVRTINLTSGDAQQLFTDGFGVTCPQDIRTLGSTAVAGPGHVCLTFESGGARCGVNSGPSGGGSIGNNVTPPFVVTMLGTQSALLQNVSAYVVPRKATLPAGTPVDIPVALDTKKGQALVYGAVAPTAQGFVGIVAQNAAVKSEGLWNITWDGASTVLWPTSLGAAHAVATDDTYAYVHDAVGVRILRFKLR